MHALVNLCKILHAVLLLELQLYLKHWAVLLGTYLGLAKQPADITEPKDTATRVSGALLYHLVKALGTVVGGPLREYVMGCTTIGDRGNNRRRLMTL